MKIEDLLALVGETIDEIQGFDPDTTDVGDIVYIVTKEGSGYEVTINA